MCVITRLMAVFPYTAYIRGTRDNVSKFFTGRYKPKSNERTLRMEYAVLTMERGGTLS